MNKFYAVLFDHLDNMTSTEQAGLETFSQANDSVDMPNADGVLKDNTAMVGYDANDVGVAFKLAGGFTAGLESFDRKASVGKHDEVITANDLGMRTYDIDVQQYGLEKLSKTQEANTKMFTIAVNIQVSKANQGLDKIMPTIMLNADQVALEATVELESVMESFTYDGSTNKSQVTKTSALSLMRDPKIFKKYSSRVTPVKTADTDGVLFNQFAFDTEVTGTTQSTAPIRFDTPINLLEITQTAASIKAGFNDDLSSLDTAVYTDSIYFGPVDANGDPTQAIGISVRDTIYSNWTYSQQDQKYDISMSTRINMVLDKNVRDTAGNVVAGISDLPDGTRVVVEMQLEGSGNIESGVVNVLAGGLSVVSATDTDGAPVGTAELAAIKATVAGFVNIGYTLETRLSNDTLRSKGLITLSESKVTLYYIPEQPPLIKYKTAYDRVNGNTVDKAVNSEIITLKAAILDQALNMIERHIANIDGFSGLDIAGVKQFGVGRDMFIPVVARGAFDRASVTTVTSKDVTADIKGSLANEILDIINVMDSVSGYGMCKAIIEPGSKTIINVWANSGITKYLNGLEGRLELGPNYAVVVHTHYRVDIPSAYITFGTDNSNVTSELNPFQFGNVVVIPSIVYDGIRAVNGATVAGTYTVPKFLPIINHAIIGVLTTVGLSG